MNPLLIFVILAVTGGAIITVRHFLSQFVIRILPAGCVTEAKCARLLGRVGTASMIIAIVLICLWHIPAFW